MLEMKKATLKKATLKKATYIPVSTKEEYDGAVMLAKSMGYKWPLREGHKSLNWQPTNQADSVWMLDDDGGKRSLRTNRRSFGILSSAIIRVREMGYEVEQFATKPDPFQSTILSIQKCWEGAGV